MVVFQKAIDDNVHSRYRYAPRLHHISCLIYRIALGNITQGGQRDRGAEGSERSEGSEGQVRLTRIEKAGHPVPVPLTPLIFIVNILDTDGSIHHRNR